MGLSFRPSDWWDDLKGTFSDIFAGDPPQIPPPPPMPDIPGVATADASVQQREQEDQMRKRRRRYYATVGSSKGYGTPAASGTNQLLGD